MGALWVVAAIVFGTATQHYVERDQRLMALVSFAGCVASIGNLLLAVMAKAGIQ